MDTAILIGLICATVGLTSFFSLGLGYLDGYKKGFHDGALKEAGKWKNRISLTMNRIDDGN